MKKILALVLALCMMSMVLPVFAETGSGLLDRFSAILGGEGGIEEKASGLLEKFSELKESFTGSDKQLSAIISSLSEKLQGMIQPGDEGSGSLLSGLKDKLGIGDVDLSGLLGGLAGGEEGFDLDSLLGGDGDAEADDDGETLEETLARLNQEAEADTGENIPNKKAAESVEEFYGAWNETRFTYLGEEYDASEFGEGLFFGENTYYVTENGEKAEDYPYSETVEMFIRDGVLKTKSEEGHWSTFVMTEDGELVMSGGSLLTYFVRAE